MSDKDYRWTHPGYGHPSMDTERTLFPSGEKQTDSTRLNQLKLLVIGPQTTWPLSASHTIIVLSPDPETIRDPSGEYAKELAKLE